jgi:insertion element IS1 protein InsB
MRNRQPSLKSRTFSFKKRKLVLECDELWSFVGSKAEQAWLWLALAADIRLIVGCAIGPYDKETAENCGIPFRRHIVNRRPILPISLKFMRAFCHPDATKLWAKKLAKPSYTLRQRCSRLVRKTLSFSQKLSNHIGTIWHFIHDSNARICAPLEPITSC